MRSLADACWGPICEAHAGMAVPGLKLVSSRGCGCAALAAGVVAWVSLAGQVAAAATLTVNTARDEFVVRDGKCSLRAAVEAVDVPSVRTGCGPVGRGSNRIVLGPGRYVLSIRASGADDDASGDLSVTGRTPLTIAGAGAARTVIDASSSRDRVLSVAHGSVLRLEGLTITGGHAPGAESGSDGTAGAGCTAGGAGSDGLGVVDAGRGGGVFNSGTLILDAVTVMGNVAGAGGAGGNAGASGCDGGSGGQGGYGGGVYNQGALSVTASTFKGNQAGRGGAGGAGTAFNPAGSGVGAPGVDGSGGQGGLGGGIFSESGRLTVSDSTLADNLAGVGGAGGGMMGAGGGGGSGGALAVVSGPSEVRNATVADNGVGSGGASPAGVTAASGSGGGLFVESSGTADDLSLRNTIVASNNGLDCASSPGSAILNGGYDLSYGDRTCPGAHRNPRLGPLQDNGGPTETLAIAAGSPAVDGIPGGTGGCPATDQRGVRRPQGRACDIGAFEFTTPTITFIAPSANGTYRAGSRIVARFHCDEGGVASAIATCNGSIALGRPIPTSSPGPTSFVVTAVDKSGNRVRKIIHYSTWQYVNPLRLVGGLTPRRIDLGVDYAGSGPLLAIGRGLVTMASDTDSGPPSCWAISCWPGGGIVVYRLLDGPYAGKYVYVAEHITVTVTAGQTVSPGQQIATLYQGYPWSEWGWAAGPGPEALAMADGHSCPCSDPGDWSTIEGRTMNNLLVSLGAPSGLLQSTPNQTLPGRWPPGPG